MKKLRDAIPTKTKLQFREIGRGFITGEAIGSIPSGRRLTKVFSDQFDRTYVQVNGELEPVNEHHNFLAA